jgi:Mn2+/Fe2+ NRAMP family transporter
VLEPIRALVLSQILNGLVAIPLVFLIVHICNATAIMGDKTNGPLANTLGWTTFGVVVLVGAASIWTLAR